MLGCARSRGAAGGAQALRSQASTGHTGADGDPAGAQSALVARLRVGCVALRPAVPRARRHDYSRECLACIIDTCLSGRRVICELAAVAERRGLPCMAEGLQHRTSAQQPRRYGTNRSPGGTRTPKLTYQRPENGEHVNRLEPHRNKSVPRLLCGQTGIVIRDRPPLPVSLCRSDLTLRRPKCLMYGSTTSSL